MLPSQAVMKLRPPVVLLTLVALGQLAAGRAEANGQTTHVWITEQALEVLEDGEVADLLRNPAHRDPLLNGAMFPDGGYAVNDGYGELAHWEPFQQAYLRWIRDSFAPPWDEGEAAAHVAFLMGMGSHGMADEVFDSLFMERSRLYDPGWDGGLSNLDTASDVLFAAEVGGIVAPNSWLPTEVLLPLFNEDLGYTVDAETLERGHNLLFVALAYTDWARNEPERIDSFTGEFPWTAENLSNLDVPGSPYREATVIADYWEDLWDRLHDPDLWADPVLELVPGSDTDDHPLSSDLVEARIHLSFSRGVAASSLGTISVLDEGGNLLPISVQHHYGDFSHAVHVVPDADWPEGSQLEVVVEPGLLNYDGVELDGRWTGSFRTTPPPSGVGGDCSCEALSPGGASSPGSAALLLLGLGLVAGSRRGRPGR